VGRIGSRGGGISTLADLYPATIKKTTRQQQRLAKELMTQIMISFSISIVWRFFLSAASSLLFAFSIFQFSIFFLIFFLFIFLFVGVSVGFVRQ